MVSNTFEKWFIISIDFVKESNNIRMPGKWSDICEINIDTWIVIVKLR